MVYPLTPEELGLNPEMPHVVWLKVNGYLMSDEAQEQRDELAEWFLRSGVEEEDMDSVFTDGSAIANWKVQAKYMVFAFRDPKKASLFKLAWG